MRFAKEGYQGKRKLRLDEDTVLYSGIFGDFEDEVACRTAHCHFALCSLLVDEGTEVLVYSDVYRESRESYAFRLAKFEYEMEDEDEREAEEVAFIQKYGWEAWDALNRRGSI